MLRSEKEIVNAIHSDDLEGLLDKLGLLTKIKEGISTCGICETQIILEKISALYTRDGVQFLVCGKDSCYREMLKRDIN